MKLSPEQMLISSSRVQPPPFPHKQNKNNNLRGRSIVFGFGIFLVLLSAYFIVHDSEKKHTPVEAQAPVEDTAASPDPSKNAPPAQRELTAREEGMLQEAIRVRTAKGLENALLSKGMNVDVDALGPHHTSLRLKWIGASKVTAYQFTHDGSDMLIGLKKAGFRKFVITDGYYENWTWDLSK